MSILKSIFLGSSWKSSLLGLLGGVLAIVAQQIQHGTIDPQTILHAVEYYLLGRITGDAALVGGGTSTGASSTGTSTTGTN